MSRDKQLGHCHGETTKDEIQGFFLKRNENRYKRLPPYA